MYRCRLLITFSAVLATACSETPTAPTPTAVVTFAVSGEQFRVLLVGEAQIAAGRAAQSGGAERIPNGRVVAGTQVNAPWSWHLEDVTFADVTIEVCDGRPSDVEREGITFGGGRFCPWTAVIVGIEPQLASVEAAAEIDIRNAAVTYWHTPLTSATAGAPAPVPSSLEMAMRP